MTNHFDKVLESKPVDRLARIVSSGGSEIPDPPPFAELDPLFLKNQAWKLREETGHSLTKCKDEICKAAGYEGFDHYVKVLKSRAEYISARDVIARKRAKRVAKKHGARLYQAHIESKI